MSGLWLCDCSDEHSNFCSFGPLSCKSQPSNIERSIIFIASIYDSFPFLRKQRVLTPTASLSNAAVPRLLSYMARGPCPPKKRDRERSEQYIWDWSWSLDPSDFYFRRVSPQSRSPYLVVCSDSSVVWGLTAYCLLHWCNLTKCYTVYWTTSVLYVRILVVYETCSFLCPHKLPK